MRTPLRYHPRQEEIDFVLRGFPVAGSDDRKGRQFVEGFEVVHDDVIRGMHPEESYDSQLPYLQDSKSRQDGALAACYLYRSLLADMDVKSRRRDEDAARDLSRRWSVELPGVRLDEASVRQLNAGASRWLLDTDVRASVGLERLPLSSRPTVSARAAVTPEKPRPSQLDADVRAVVASDRILKSSRPTEPRRAVRRRRGGR